MKIWPFMAIFGRKIAEKHTFWAKLEIFFSTLYHQISSKFWAFMPKMLEIWWNYGNLELKITEISSISQNFRQFFIDLPSSKNIWNLGNLLPKWEIFWWNYTILQCNCIVKWILQVKLQKIDFSRNREILPRIWRNRRIYWYFLVIWRNLRDFMAQDGFSGLTFIFKHEIYRCPIDQAKK